MTPSGAQPLVVAYLSDLELALAGTDPQEREDTLAAVREHIEDALDGSPRDAATATAVLSGLGPVERIAATATPAVAPPTTPADAASSSTWTSTALLTCAVVSFIGVFVFPSVAAPVAVGTIVGAAILLRRGHGRTGFLRSSIAFSFVTLLIAALLAAFLLSSSSVDPIPSDPVPADAS